jgi:release factor glutamine methyltransferase
VVHERVAAAAPRWLAPRGSLLLDIGGDQADGMTEALTAAGLADVRVHADDEGRDRAIEARRITG